MSLDVARGVLYLLLWWWGFAFLLTFTTFENSALITNTCLTFAITVTTVHFGSFAIGVLFIHGYTPYNVKPIFLYIVTDTVILVSALSVFMSCIQHPGTLSSVPLVGCWFIVLSLTVNVWKYYELVFPAPNDDVVCTISLC